MVTGLRRRFKSSLSYKKQLPKMSTIKETIWRVLGHQGKSFDLKVSEKEYIITATSRHIVIQKRKPDRYGYNRGINTGYDAGEKSSELVMDFDLTERTFGLYIDWELPELVILAIQESLYIPDDEFPQYDTDEKGNIGIMMPNKLRFPKIINVPRVITQREYSYWTYPTLEFPNGESVVEGDNIKIHNDVISKFEQNKLNGYIPNYLTRKFKLANGLECYIESYSYKWWLVRPKKIGKFSVHYPIDLEGKPLLTQEADVFWDERGHNNNVLLQRLICEQDIQIPEDFESEMVNYHFYGRSFGEEDIRQYFVDFIANNNECTCERCQGFKIYKKEKGAVPYYRGWSMDHYKTMHAGINGSLPTDRELLKDCNCKACKAFRNTRDRKQDYLKRKFWVQMQTKGYTENEIQYLTGGWKADPQIYPDEIPNPGLMTIDDWLWRPKNAWFKDIISDRSKVSPISFENLQIRYKLAYIHCRLTLVEWKDAPIEAASWLTEVWNTQFNPSCNCKLCTELKTNPEMLLTIANELLMEPVNPATYTTSVFNIHFQSNYWSSNETKPKEEYVKFFNEYVLYGKYCECNKCLNFMKKLEDSDYLPPAELEAPTCPLCGGRVHNKDLIYQNKAIAKAVVEKGASNLIGIKTALCCGCYNKFRADRERRQKILEMVRGDTFYAEIRGETDAETGELLGMRRRRVKEVWPEDTPKEEKEPGTGELYVKDIPLCEFVSLNNVTFKLSEGLETEIRARS